MLDRGSFRKIVKREQKLTVKRLGGHYWSHTYACIVHKFQEGGKILARESKGFPLPPSAFLLQRAVTL